MAITFKAAKPSQPIIRIGVKGLAKYMTGTASQQRKVLRDYKYPDPEGSAQAVYYREARDFIEVYHRKSHKVEWLREQARALRGLAIASIGNAKTRLLHNARSLEQYADNFWSRKYGVLDSFRHVLRIEGVEVTVVPDMHVRENGREKIIKFEFSATKPNDKVCQIIGQLMFEAALKEGLSVKSADILVIDIPRKEIHKGARAGSRTLRDIEDTCKNIAALWPGI